MFRLFNILLSIFCINDSLYLFDMLLLFPSFDTSIFHKFDILQFDTMRFDVLHYRYFAALIFCFRLFVTSINCFSIARNYLISYSKYPPRPHIAAPLRFCRPTATIYLWVTPRCPAACSAQANSRRMWGRPSEVTGAELY